MRVAGLALLDELSTGLDPRSRRAVWEIVEEVRDGGATIVLVTHFMEEARHLCDRVALFDRGRIRALDSPDGVIARTGAPTVMTFAPSSPLDATALMGIDGVTSVRRREDSRIELSVTDDAVLAVLAWLGAQGVRAGRLRVVDSTLDDAFLDLTSAAEEQVR